MLPEALLAHLLLVHNAMRGFDKTRVPGITLFFKLFGRRLKCRLVVSFFFYELNVV